MVGSFQVKGTQKVLSALHSSLQTSSRASGAVRMSNGKGKSLSPKAQQGREAVATPRAPRALSLGNPRTRALSYCTAPFLPAGHQGQEHAPEFTHLLLQGTTGSSQLLQALTGSQLSSSLRWRQPGNAQGSSGSWTPHTALQADMNLHWHYTNTSSSFPSFLLGIQLHCKKTQIQLTQEECDLNSC